MYKSLLLHMTCYYLLRETDLVVRKVNVEAVR